MKNSFLHVLVFLIAGCASTEVANRKPAEMKVNEENELMAMYERKEVGLVRFYTGPSFEKNPNIYLVGTELSISLANIKAAEGLELYLPQSQYTIYFDFQTKRQKTFSFYVKNGETSTYKWDGYDSVPVEVQKVPLNITIKAKGSPYTRTEISRILNDEINFRLYFDVDYGEPVGGRVIIKVRPRFPNNITKIAINGVDKSAHFQQGFLETNESVVIGENKFEISLVNKQDTKLTKNISFTVLSPEQIQIQTDRKRQERIVKERELLAQKLEQERIAREGDGTTEDLLCKKYGLKPLTSGYAECRMRLDFAKAESQKKQEQYEREKAEYDRQVAAIQKEREKQRAMKQLELGLRMMGGQSPIDAVNSVGAGMPIAPSHPMPINQTITMPNGRMINCTTFGTNTNCF